jgi:hypothetical protein
MGAVRGAPKQLQQNHERSQITITDIIIMGKFEMLRELPKCDIEARGEHMLLGKWRRYTCPAQGCHKPSVRGGGGDAKSAK